jgi:hypothetical protein
MTTATTTTYTSRVINVTGTTIMLDELVITDKKILANLTDVVLHDKEGNLFTDGFIHTR